MLWVPAAGAQYSSWTGNVNFFLGMKALDRNDWQPTENHLAFGLLGDFRPRAFPFNFAVDIIRSRDDGNMVIVDPVLGDVAFSLKSRTTEFNFGLRKYWEGHPMVRPYAGGGVSLIYADAESTARGIAVSDDDRGVGFWLNGGVFWIVEEHINFGFDMAYSRAEVTLFDVFAEAGGFRIGGLVGFHF
jgi:hypothetical protein